MGLELSFPCLHAEVQAFRYAGVKTGIQDGKEKAGFLLEFIPKKIGAGMTTRRTRIGKVDFKSTICLRTPRLQGEGSLVYRVRNNAPLGFESRYSGTGISNGVNS
jgi:hypothetical protein